MHTSRAHLTTDLSAGLTVSLVGCPNASHTPLDTARLLERSGSRLPWVADVPVPGLSVRRCVERLQGAPGGDVSPGGNGDMRLPS